MPFVEPSQSVLYGYLLTLDKQVKVSSPGSKFHKRLFPLNNDHDCLSHACMTHESHIPFRNSYSCFSNNGINRLSTDAPVVEVPNEVFIVQDQEPIKTPSLEDLLKVDTDSDIKNLKAPDDDSGDTLLSTIGTPLMPFMLPVFDQNADIDLLQIYSDLKETINIYASSHPDNTTISEDCKITLQFLWVALQEPPLANIVDPTQIIRPTDPTIGYPRS